LDNEQVPTVEEVKNIRAAASMRGRICVGAVAYGGLRPEVLGHQNINDGLKLGDLPELDLRDLTFVKQPTLVEVRPELSKAGHKYRTFFPQDTCRDISAYLQRRGKSGEELNEDSPLVAVSSSQKRKGWRALRNIENGFITRAVISRDIRKAMRPTYSYRPYVLRSYFSTRLLMAVSDGILDNNYRIYWMGHRGKMLARYSSNKAFLPSDMIDNMRKAYERSQRYLLGGILTEESIRKKQLIDTAKMLGFEEEKLTKLKEVLARAKSIDDAVDEFRKLQPPLENESFHKIVSKHEEMLQLLNNGWEIVQELSGNKYLMKNLK
jgi:hypothetical protein